MARSKTTTVNTTTSNVKAAKASSPKVKEVKLEIPVQTETHTMRQEPMLRPPLVPIVFEVAEIPFEFLPLHLRALVRVGELAFAASDATLPLAMQVGLHGSAHPEQWGVKREGNALFFRVHRDAYLANKAGWQRWLAGVQALAKAGYLKAAFTPKGLRVSKE